MNGDIKQAEKEIYLNQKHEFRKIKEQAREMEESIH